MSRTRTDIGHFVNEKVQVIPGIQDTRTIITFKAFWVATPPSAGLGGAGAGALKPKLALAPDHEQAGAPRRSPPPTKT